MLISLDKKMVFLVMMVGLFALIVTGYVSYGHATNVIKTGAEDQLRNEAAMHGSALRTLLESRLAQNSMLGGDADLQRWVAEIGSAAAAARGQAAGMNHGGVGAGDGDHHQKILDRIRDIEWRTGLGAAASDIDIINDKGAWAFALNPEPDRIQLDLAYHERMSQEAGGDHYDGSFVEIESGADGPRLVIVSPLIADDGGHAGTIISRILAPIVDSALLSGPGPDKHGEISVISDDGQMIYISQPAYGHALGPSAYLGDGGFLSICFDDGSQYVGAHLNHVGHKVYGATYCAQDLGIMLLAEIDRDVVDAPLGDLQNQLVQAGIAIIAGIGGMAVIVARTISRPIHRLKKVTSEIARGNFDVRTGVRTNDEIGDLAAEFDTMADKLKESMLRIKEKESVISQQEGVLLQFSSHSEKYCVGMVDIMSSTKICANMSDMQMSEFYKIFINSMGLIIQKYEGTIVKNIGDALLFYFPIYGHDEKQILRRCLDCCINMSEIHDSVSDRLRRADLPLMNYRISSTYGIVRIAKSSTSLVEDIFGTTVNRCSKINRTAPPNGVIIGEHFYKVAKGFEEYNFEKVERNISSDDHGYDGYVVTRKEAAEVEAKPSSSASSFSS